MKKTILQIILIVVLVFGTLGIFIACDVAETSKTNPNGNLSAVQVSQTYKDTDEGIDFILLTIYGDGYVNKYNPREVTIYTDETVKALVGWDMGEAIIYTNLNRATVTIHYSNPLE